MTATRLAMVFPGQGSQRPGMLESVRQNDGLERLTDAAEALTGLELRRIAADGTPEELSDTRAAQPLLYLSDWAWAVALMDSGIVPDVVAGHSLGEFAALAIAGVFSVEAGLELVVERGTLMATAVASTPGGMCAVLGLDADSVGTAVTDIDGVWVANDNAPTQVVISGTHPGLAEATDALLDAGARRIIPLNVAGPFHSPLMEPAQDAFEDVLNSTEFRDASIPILQNTNPTPATDAATILERLVGQITAPVRWTETMRAIAFEGPTTVLEAGPGSVLKGLARGMENITAIAIEDVGLKRIVEEVPRQ